MLFTQPAFFVFLALVLPLYWVVGSVGSERSRRRTQHLVLVAASCWFYMSWSVSLVFLLVGVLLFDWAVGMAIGATDSKRRRKLLLSGSIIVNLGVLALFKYADFLLANLHAIAGWFGPSSRHTLGFVLPVGISFYTFESMSYVIDLYQRKREPVRSPLDYAVFLTFFPHLVAGPIVRIRDFAPQLAHAMSLRKVRLRRGMNYFLLGLVKKLLISDWVSVTSDHVFARPQDYGMVGVWLGVVAYAVQIYCDFSGYTDMAIGTAHFFGYDLPENFRLPYLASNVSEFWQRWHISLSSWLRDYLYIPLGGSRGTVFLTYRNLLITMLLGGLWHGASWNFVIWGGLHGIALIVHHEFRRIRASAAGPLGTAETAPVRHLTRALSKLATFGFVCVAWVFFRSPDLGTAVTILGRMAGLADGGAVEVTLPLVAALALAALGHLAPVGLTRELEEDGIALPWPVEAIGYATVVAAVLVFAPSGAQPFIYFQF